MHFFLLFVLKIHFCPIFTAFILCIFLTVILSWIFFPILSKICVVLFLLVLILFALLPVTDFSYCFFSAILICLSLVTTIYAFLRSFCSFCLFVVFFLLFFFSFCLHLFLSLFKIFSIHFFYPRSLCSIPMFTDMFLLSKS